MILPPPDSLERLTHADLIGVVRDLIGEVTRMQAETEKLDGALAKLRVEHQAVKDELARLKHLPPRPPIKPSGMDKSTQAKGRRLATRRRALIAPARQPTRQTEDWRNHCCEGRPAYGLAQQGIEDVVVQDLSLNPQVTRYRRERWETPDGKTIIAALDPGLVGGYGPNLHRLVLTLHFSGQVTCERITALLNGMGVVISKRQVVRLLTAKLETFRAEDEAVLKAGFAAPMSRSTIRGRAMRQEWLHHANRFLQLHDVSHRSLQIAPGVSVAAVRRRVALCDQRRRACLYGRAQPASDRHRQVQGA